VSQLRTVKVDDDENEDVCNNPVLIKMHYHFDSKRILRRLEARVIVHFNKQTNTKIERQFMKENFCEMFNQKIFYKKQAAYEAK
jgi:hypothetical protein